MKSRDWIPISLTIVLLLVAILLVSILDETKVSAYGSIIAASGSVIAILWFTIGMKRDSEQQRIQNKQFHESFGKILEQGRREALVLAKSILDHADNQVAGKESGRSTVGILNGFLEPFDYRTLYNSKDAEVVSKLAKEWLDRMGPGFQIVRSIKSAATVYLKSINAENIDYSKKPEEFVYLYGSLFWDEPFFDNYRVIGEILSQFHYLIQPGSKGISLAVSCAQSLVSGLPLKEEKVKEGICALLAENKDVPQIVFERFPDLKSDLK